MTVEQAIAEAKAAYHELRMGRAAVEFRDQNGETVKYNKADIVGLAAYIQDLQRQLDPTVNVGPMRAWF